MKKFELTARSKSLILSGVACVGVVLTGYFSAKGALKAEERDAKKDKVLAYAPAIASGCVTIACICASTYISGEEIGALTLALAASAQRFADYRKVVHENVSAEEEERINEAFYLKEIERLETELAEREHPREDDDLCDFVDSFSCYTFRARYEDVEAGIEKAINLYKEQGFIPWCDIFYLLNDGDTGPSRSIIGDDGYGGYGWSEGMFEQMYENALSFDVFLEQLTCDRPNVFTINYNVAPEPCYLEY